MNWPVYEAAFVASISDTFISVATIEPDALEGVASVLTSKNLYSLEAVIKEPVTISVLSGIGFPLGST